MHWLAGFRARRRRTLIRLGKRVRRPLDRLLLKYSLVGDPMLFDTRQLPFVQELEPKWRAIRDELEAVLVHRDHLPPLTSISPDHAKIADDRWKVFFLQGYGIRCSQARERCPETSRLLDAIPDLQMAFFSILGPGIKVPLHRGVTKGFITWHLPLIVPERREHCSIRLEGEVYHWTEGESLVFDDTLEHEAWNDTDEERVVLLINFLRPMRWQGRLLARGFLAAMRRSAWVTDAHANHLAWEKEFETAVQAVES